MKKQIVIVGGGTAGWMTANILAYALQHHPFQITLIESSDIDVVGVGEGSTPALKVFFDSLGISEKEWMPECNATYKCGITFRDWSRKPGFDEYFHPFASVIDSQTLSAFKHNVQARLAGINVESHPNLFFLSAYLAENHLAPTPNYNFPFEMAYGYHFDATLLGRFLRDKALQRGVKHRVGTVEQVVRRDNGDVVSVLTKDNISLAGDIFIDCSGFRSVLSQAALNTPYHSYSDALFNDAAVAIPSELSEEIPSQTIATALKFGWAWKIPLTNRFGNGYVYSSHYCSADEAEMELRRHLNLCDADVPVRHLKMKVGRVEKTWHQNVVAIGLSQGFIEPLEATALLLIQQSASLFAHYFIQGKFSGEFAHTFNQAINQQFDHTKDYIYSHYQTNSRTDTAYWVDNRENKSAMSESLIRLYSCWVRGGDLEREIHDQKIERFYPVSSWYCLFAGMGMLPHEKHLQAPRSGQNAFQKYKVQDFLQRCALNFPSHREQIQRLSGASMSNSEAVV